MLQELIGCRLESVRLSKFSWGLEFEGGGAQPARYLLTSGAAVSCVGAEQAGQAIYDLINEMLEDELVEARYDKDSRVIALGFRKGVRLKFSNQDHQGGDNSAIVTNLANGEWELFS